MTKEILNSKEKDGSINTDRRKYSSVYTGISSQRLDEWILEYSDSFRRQRIYLDINRRATFDF